MEETKKIEEQPAHLEVSHQESFSLNRSRSESINKKNSISSTNPAVELGDIKIHIQKEGIKEESDEGSDDQTQRQEEIDQPQVSIVFEEKLRSDSGRKIEKYGTTKS